VCNEKLVAKMKKVVFLVAKMKGIAGDTLTLLTCYTNFFFFFFSYFGEVGSDKDSFAM
jgi:hypothetical protein